MVRDVRGNQTAGRRQIDLDGACRKAVEGSEVMKKSEWRLVKSGWWKNNSLRMSIILERDGLWYAYSHTSTVRSEGCKTLEKAIAMVEKVMRRSGRGGGQ